MSGKQIKSMSGFLMCCFIAALMVAACSSTRKEEHWSIFPDPGQADRPGTVFSIGESGVRTYESATEVESRQDERQHPYVHQETTQTVGFLANLLSWEGTPIDAKASVDSQEVAIFRLALGNPITVDEASRTRALSAAFKSLVELFGPTGALY